MTEERPKYSAAVRYNPRMSRVTEIVLDTPEEQTTITPVSAHTPLYHDYTIQELWARESVKVAAQGLLDVAAYVQENRARLEQEAQADYEQNAQAIAADYADIQGHSLPEPPGGGATCANQTGQPARRYSGMSRNDKEKA